MPTKDIEIYAEIIEGKARNQVYEIASHPCLNGRVRIMPDVHAGEGCVVGFTGVFTDGIIPNVVGVDIGCGVATAGIFRRDGSPLTVSDIEKIAEKRGGGAAGFWLDFDSAFRKKVPTGTSAHGISPKLSEEEAELASEMDGALAVFSNLPEGKRSRDARSQFGTLGGGNHFVEVERDEHGNLYMTVHSGSRNFGHRVGMFFQERAKELSGILLRKKERNAKGDNIREAFSGIVDVSVPSGLEYLPFVLGTENERILGDFPFFAGETYLVFADIARRFAEANRKRILRDSFSALGLDDVAFDEKRLVESVHNYVEETGNGAMVRKGAIRANEGERVVIPLSMRDGTILGTGLGNEKWNFSAPHGAGRLFGRRAMKEKLESGGLSMEMFREDMAGIYGTSVTESTIDESSFAYKPSSALLDFAPFAETVRVDKVLKPVCNIKAL